MNEFIDWIMGIVTKSVNSASIPESGSLPYTDEPAIAPWGAQVPTIGKGREYPTPTEQRDAWVRRNGPDEFNDAGGNDE